MIALVLFLSLVVFLLLSVPIGICLGLATMAVMVLVDGTPPMVLLARSVVTGADSFPLIAVPLFILAGDVMQKGGMSRRLVGFAALVTGVALVWIAAWPKAQAIAREEVDFVLEKTRFYETYGDQLNDRQARMVARIFAEGC